MKLLKDMQNCLGKILRSPNQQNVTVREKDTDPGQQDLQQSPGLSLGWLPLHIFSGSLNMEMWSAFIAPAGDRILTGHKPFGPQEN